MGIIEIIKGFFALVFLQVSWSYVGRQTLGFLYTIILLAKNQTDSFHSEPTKSQIKERIWQKQSLNTNPYCTGFMIGIALNNDGEIFKDSFFSLQHIFGSIGDEFFWHLLRPALLSLAVLCSLIGFLTSTSLNITGLFKFSSLVFLIPYMCIAQGMRIHGLYQGKMYGKQTAVYLVEDLRKCIPLLYNILAFIMGILFVLLPILFLYNFSDQAYSVKKSIFIAILILFSILISYLALRSERSSSYLLLFGLMIYLIIKLL
jgi:mannose/fructose/N-acetylgalactosamine-specific phosphotransferase system component IID